MTNKEILQANLLDIVFDGRNKEYGAYALRKEYNNRLLIAMGISMSVIVLVIFFSFNNGNKNSFSSLQMKNDSIVVRTVHLIEPKKVKPEVIKEIVKPKTVKAAAAKLTSTIDIKPDNQVKETMPSIEDLKGKIISTETIDAPAHDGNEKEKNVVDVVGVDNAEPAKPENKFAIQERDPEFPGGVEALRKFLFKNLVTPDALNVDEKKIVQIKFKIDKDGSVTTFEILTSGGHEFDSEVVRVCKKMPRWVPAIQNGIHVPVNFILPVTFIGVEQ
jgi:protein TonB